MKAWVALLSCAGLLAASHHEALACGACFVPPDSPTVVSGHRMVMSISDTQTVLWDQIQYQGAPEDFAWVLPVKPGATIEEASDAFFETLEATTRTTVTGPPVNCGGSFDDSYYEGGDGCSPGCSAGEAGDDGGGGGTALGGREQDPVEVVHQGSVGPYETVTLSTDTPGALNTWLEQHGYNVDAASQPIIDDYVAEGFDFIALRLQPGLGIQQMKPVRVIMPAGGLSLPLRMVAIGTGAQTPIVLYFIGEGRYRADNFQEVLLSQSDLTWDYATNTSNYETLRQAALAQNGRAYLTTFAQPQFFSNTLFPAGDGASRDFLYLFAEQARANGEAPGGCAVTTPYNDGTVTNPCPPGTPYDSPDCPAVGPDEIDARLLGCDDAYDVALALDGMRFRDVWVTRIEGIWPREALAEDLEVAATTQTPVASALTAQQTLNDDKACEGFGGVLPWKKLNEPPRSRMAPWMLLFASLLWISRRTARSRWVRSRLGVASV